MPDNGRFNSVFKGLKYVHKMFADIIKLVVAAQPVCEMWRL